MNLLDGVAKGDEVAVTMGWSNRSYRIEKVTHATKTRVYLGGVAYRRKDGRRVGGNDSVFSRSSITPVTDEIRSHANESERRSAAVAVIRGMRFDSHDYVRSIPLERLEAIASVIMETAND